MKKIIVFLCIMFVSVSCSSSVAYDENDIAAIVRGKEITVRDIRLVAIFNNEELPQVVKHYVREEIMIQEAKQMGIELPKEVKEVISSDHSLPPEPPEGKENPILEFYKSQAKELGMTAEEYVDIYICKSTERSEYVSRYINQELGEGTSQGEKGKEYHNRLNEFYDQLLTKYDDEIEILIK
ncbi:hypothetical protein [Radiobacillus sp. PE A8.2]|uniref:hypothetical protein n=1 Tax=Radiobacillus sp. PE A8.2 TaxID=3380349 RepID=UPI00388F066D